MNLQEIIQSGYKATIIECGHGAEITNAFLSQPGASNFIVKCMQPYSKEVQWHLYPDAKKYRSVSKEFVKLASMYELKQMIDTFGDHQKFLVITTSFQLDDGNSLTHGYLNITQYNNGELVEKAFHFSFYRSEKYDRHTRKTAWITAIKHELLNVIYTYISNKQVISKHIDGVFDGVNYELNIVETLKVNHTPNKTQNQPDENFLCFTPDGNFHRFEDVIRLNTGQNKGIILQKGSYNPLHRMHKKIADNAKTKYHTYPHALVLSMHTCDKGYNNAEILAKRIENLLKEGYTVIVTKSGYFLDNIRKIREHYYENKLEVVFPVGEDTMERFFRDWETYFDEHFDYHDFRYSTYSYTFRNVTWLITKRESDTKNFSGLIADYQKVLPNFVYTDLEMDDISSTAIRSGKIKNE